MKCLHECIETKKSIVKSFKLMSQDTSFYGFFYLTEGKICALIFACAELVKFFKHTKIRNGVFGNVFGKPYTFLTMKINDVTTLFKFVINLCMYI